MHDGKRAAFGQAVKCGSSLKAPWVSLDKSFNLSVGEPLKTLCGFNGPGVTPGTSLIPRQVRELGGASASAP